jgi:hypothetical protein
MRTVPLLEKGKRYLITFPDSKIPSKVGTFIRSENGTDLFEVNGKIDIFTNEPDGLYPNDEQYYLLDIPSLYDLALKKVPGELPNYMLPRGGKRRTRRKRRGPTRD